MHTTGFRREEFKRNQAINMDYRNTGFDRGHLNPNFYHCDEARTATFTLTNAVPQNACFNELMWYALENESKKIMKSMCNFAGATRFFVTGTIPSRKRIPNMEIDLEADSSRDYNRVSVPSHMWTAACCDSSAASQPAITQKGFSFGYLGENKADGSVEVLSIRELENAISAIPAEAAGQERSIRIFVDDYCNEDSDNSKEALAKIGAVVDKSNLNNQDTLGQTTLYKLPPKKRYLSSREFKSVKDLGSNVLSDFILGVALPAGTSPVVKYRDTLKSSSDLTVIMTGFKSRKRKRESSQRKKEFDETSADDTSTAEDTYMFAPEQNAMINMTVSGDYCRLDHKCDYHDGRRYRWCKTASSWDYCCVNDCLSANYQEAVPTCDVGKGIIKTCSIRYSIVTVKGGRCRQDHECALRGQSFYWCYSDFNGNWEYCCQPWHRCDYYNGEPSGWCYVGSSLRTDRRSCYY